MTAKLASPRRRVADTQQIVAIHSMMSAHLRAEGGFAIYENGWNDERVLREIMAANPGWNIALPTIARTRVENFGHLRSPRRINFEDTLIMLKTRLDRLEADNAELKEKVSKMELHLRHRGGYVPPPGKLVSTPPNNGTLG